MYSYNISDRMAELFVDAVSSAELIPYGMDPRYIARFYTAVVSAIL
jgi:hypothetical protein